MQLCFLTGDLNRKNHQKVSNLWPISRYLHVEVLFLPGGIWKLQNLFYLIHIGDLMVMESIRILIINQSPRIPEEKNTLSVLQSCNRPERKLLPCWNRSWIRKRWFPKIEIKVDTENLESRASPDQKLSQKGGLESGPNKNLRRKKMISISTDNLKSRISFQFSWARNNFMIEFEWVIREMSG